MNTETKGYCSGDTEELKKYILENPELPLMIFCGEGAYSGEYYYNIAFIYRIEIEELTWYEDLWMKRDNYKEKLKEDLRYEKAYEDLSDKEYEKMIEGKNAEAEFVKAIVVYVE